MRFVSQTPASRLRRVFLVHGEPDRMEALADTLEDQGYQVTLPIKGKTYVLD